MNWIQAHKREWRTAVLGLFLLGFLGPWAYESAYSPLEASCNGILLESGDCGLLIPGIFIMGWPQFYLLIIPTLNIVLTLLSLSRIERISRLLPLCWSLAVGAGLTLILSGAPSLHPALWGIWLSLGLAIIMLILEIFVSLRQPEDKAYVLD